MIDQATLISILGGVIFLFAVALLIVVFLVTRSLVAVTVVLGQIAQTPAFIDPIERLAVQVVPSWVIPLILSGGEGFKNLIQTPEGKAFVDAILAFVRQATDGLPNVPAGGYTTTSTAFKSVDLAEPKG
jgi:hypothetical protein